MLVSYEDRVNSKLLKTVPDASVLIKATVIFFDVSEVALLLVFIVIDKYVI